MLRANAPAMIRRKTAAVACIAVRVLRSLACENLPRRSLARVAYSAGRNPTRRPTPEDTTSAPASRRQLSSRFNCKGRGKGRSGTNSVTKPMATAAAATPRPPATRPRPRLSTATCRTSLNRLAPRACRIDISRRRTAASASRRPEMLAQTMSRKVPTSPDRTARGPNAIEGSRASFAVLIVRARGCPESPVHSSG